jgi:hypothetical protein
MTLGSAFVQGEAFEDERGGLLRRQVLEVGITREATKTFALDPPEPGKHHLADIACLEKAEDSIPLQAAPFLLIVIRTEDRDHEIGLFFVKVWQIEGEVAAGELGFVIFVVQDRRFAEALREEGCDLRDIVPLFPRKGEGDAEAFGTHLSRHRRLYRRSSSTLSSRPRIRHSFGGTPLRGFRPTWAHSSTGWKNVRDRGGHEYPDLCTPARGHF